MLSRGTSVRARVHTAQEFPCRSDKDKCVHAVVVDYDLVAVADAAAVTAAGGGGGGDGG